MSVGSDTSNIFGFVDLAFVDPCGADAFDDDGAGIFFKAAAAASTRHPSDHRSDRNHRFDASTSNQAGRHDHDSDDVANGMEFATAWLFSEIGLLLR